MAGKGVFKDLMDGDTFKFYADGEWKRSSSGASVNILNPSTRKVQYKVQGSFSHSLLSFALIPFAASDYRSTWIETLLRRASSFPPM